MDLIERQAAIDAVENAFDRETILNRFVRKIAISAIRHLPPAQPEQRWIPCSERLPENGYWLWSAKGGEVQKDFYWDGHWEHAEKYGYEVVAWMPLPEPYKEDDHETD